MHKGTEVFNIRSYSELWAVQGGVVKHRETKEENRGTDKEITVDIISHIKVTGINTVG